MTDFVFQFRVELLHITPPIWRRIQVPKSFTFWDLHVAIQDAMGWKDSHLHLFRLIGSEAAYGIPSPDGDDPVPTSPCWETEIATEFQHHRPIGMYEYDFGDGWLHLLVLEKVEPREQAVSYPRCLDGARRCPPEDCGGQPGYEELLEVLANPQHPLHKHKQRWAGRNYDPEHFEAANVKFTNAKRRLAKMQRDTH